MTIAFQKNLWGQHERVQSWYDIARSVILEMGERVDLPETDYNRQIYAQVLVKLPQIEAIFDLVARTEDRERGKRALVSLIARSEAFPALDTLIRGVRKSKADLREAGLLHRNSNHAPLPSYEEIMAEVEDADEQPYSLKKHFGNYLCQHHPHFGWQSGTPLTLLQGGTVTPDFVSQKLGIAILIHTWKGHRHREAFCQDREKIRGLQQLGYYTLPFHGPELALKGGFRRALEYLDRFITDRKLT